MDTAFDANAAAWLSAIRISSHAAARLHLRRDQDVNVRGAGGVTALHVVAEVGQLGKLRSLLLERADASAIDDQGRTPLMVAQYHMKTEVIMDLIQHEELVRALTRHLGETPTPNQIHITKFQQKWCTFRDDVYKRLHDGSMQLIEAARVGDLATVRRLVQSGEVHIDYLDQSTAETAFSAALAGGWLVVCDYLLANGAHAYAPCVVDGKTQSSLLTAVAQGSVQFVRQLLRTRRVHSSCPKYDPTTCALTEALLYGTNEMVDVLLDAGVKFLWSSNYQSFPPLVANAVRGFHLAAKDMAVWQRLNFACWRQDLQRIQQLFASYDVLRDRAMMATRGASALYIAVYLKNKEIATQLLARGVQVNSTMTHGQTAMVAAVLVDSLPMMQFLLERGGDLSIGLNGRRAGFAASLLHEAIVAGAMDCVRFLLPMETHPERLDKALKLAVRQNNHDLVHLLLDRTLPSNANVFHTCVATTKCPLMLDVLLTRCCAERYSINFMGRFIQYLCSYSEVDLVAVYVAHGIDVNAPSRSGNALLHAVSSVGGGKPDVIRLLVDSGADVSSVDEHGCTALDLVERILQGPQLTPNSRLRFESSRDILRGVSHVSS